MIARCSSSCLVGIDASPVVVEAQITKGLPGFDLVGMPDRAARECVVRVKAALTASGFELPPRHVVVNVAPSGVRKTSAGLDVPIATAVLGAIGVLGVEALERIFLLGELSLSGELRPVPGALVHLIGAARRGTADAIVARDQADARLARGIDVRGASTLIEIVAALRGSQALSTIEARASPDVASSIEDFADVAGQAAAKRALVIAAAGDHAILLSGPPGSGKTMLARRLPGILPPPSDADAMTIAMIASAAGVAPIEPSARPFRAPHHTASASALVGGGDPIRPGEVTLAHGGVLFLDELPELRRDALECLRTTMEQCSVTVVRAHGRATMPAAPLVVAAMNPCPCGFQGDPKRLCTCTPDRVEAYRARISGPILDRFDLHVHVPRQAASTFAAAEVGETSALVRERVRQARALLDSDARPHDPRSLARALPAEAARLLERAVDKLGLSARVHAKVLRLSRTLAALRNSPCAAAEDVAEALLYRGLDRARSPSGQA